jgi:hypothetical protein
MTASTPGPAEQAVVDRQVARTVDDPARDDGDRCPRAAVEVVHRDSHATLPRTARGTTSCRAPAVLVVCAHIAGGDPAEGPREPTDPDAADPWARTDAVTERTP